MFSVVEVDTVCGVHIMGVRLGKRAAKTIIYDGYKWKHSVKMDGVDYYARGAKIP